MFRCGFVSVDFTHMLQSFVIMVYACSSASKATVQGKLDVFG